MRVLGKLFNFVLCAFQAPGFLFFLLVYSIGPCKVGWVLEAGCSALVLLSHLCIRNPGILHNFLEYPSSEISATPRLCLGRRFLVPVEARLCFWLRSELNHAPNMISPKGKARSKTLRKSVTFGLLERRSLYNLKTHYGACSNGKNFVNMHTRPKKFQNLR